MKDKPQRKPKKPAEENVLLTGPKLDDDIVDAINSRSRDTDRDISYLFDE